jgi:hypothetical protein
MVEQCQRVLDVTAGLEDSTRPTCHASASSAAAYQGECKEFYHEIHKQHEKENKGRIMAEIIYNDESHGILHDQVWREGDIYSWQTHFQE